MTKRPTILAAGAAGAALIVAVAVLLVGSLTRPDEPTLPPAASSSAPPTFNPSAGDASPDPRSSSSWRSVVDHFATNFTDTAGGDQGWRDRLRGDRTPPYVTNELANQLGTVDSRNVPQGRYDQAPEVVRNSAYDISVKVSYEEGWSMVLHLITDGNDWQVYSYDRWQQ